MFLFAATSTGGRPLILLRPSQFIPTSFLVSYKPEAVQQCSCLPSCSQRQLTSKQTSAMRRSQLQWLLCSIVASACLKTSIGSVVLNGAALSLRGGGITDEGKAQQLRPLPRRPMLMQLNARVLLTEITARMQKDGIQRKATLDDFPVSRGERDGVCVCRVRKLRSS